MDANGAALDRAVQRIRAYAPDMLVVSLGVDRFESDPVGGFQRQTEDFLRVGQVIGRTGLPTHFVKKGGFALDALDVNVANVLCG